MRTIEIPRKFKKYSGNWLDEKCSILIQWEGIYHSINGVGTTVYQEIKKNKATFSLFVSYAKNLF